MHRGSPAPAPPPLLRHRCFATARALLQLFSWYGLRLACGVVSAGAHARAARFPLRSMWALFVFSLVIAMTSARINGLLRSYARNAKTAPRNSHIRANSRLFCSVERY